jgi:hypothetical protein
MESPSWNFRDLALATAVVVALPAAAFAQWSMEGQWSGIGREQPVRPGINPEYPIRVTFSGGTGRIDYPATSSTPACGGNLLRISGSDTYAIFREQITYGNCLDGGEVTLSLAQNGLSFTWRGADNIGTFITLTAVLYRY